MMTAFMIYLWSILGSIQVTNILFLVFGGAFYLTLKIFQLTFSEDCSWDVDALKKTKELIKAFPKKTYIFLLFFAFLVPSRKDIALIYVVPKIINSEVIQKDVPELYDIGMKVLKEKLLEETKEKK